MAGKSGVAAAFASVLTRPAAEPFRGDPGIEVSLAVHGKRRQMFKWNRRETGDGSRRWFSGEPGF